MRCAAGESECDCIYCNTIGCLIKQVKRYHKICIHMLKSEVLLMICKHESRGRVVPEGEGLETTTARLRGVIMCLLTAGWMTSNTLSLADCY